MKKANEEHPVYVSLRDWSKVRKANTVAEKTERKESIMYHFDKEAMMYVETGYGFNPNNSTVNEVKGIDPYNRLIMGAMVFRGTWEECMEFVEQAKQRKEN